MASIKDIQKVWNGKICRRCLNMRYDLKLMRDDCSYGETGICPSCEEERHLVVGVNFAGRKMLRDVDAADFWREEDSRPREEMERNVVDYEIAMRDRKIAQLEKKVAFLMARYKEFVPVMNDMERVLYDDGVMQKA